MILSLGLFLTGCGGGGGSGSVAVEQTYSISGKVINASGAGVAGVVITLGGTASGTQTTAGDGTYTFPSLRKGDYSLTPSLPGYFFSPEKITSVTISNSNLIVKNLKTTPAAATYTVSGKVLLDGSGLPGTSVKLYNANFEVYTQDGLLGANVSAGTVEKETVTVVGGSYTFVGVPGDGSSYIIIPSSTTYLFNPKQSKYFTITDGTTLYLYDPEKGGNTPIMGGIYNSFVPIATGLDFSASLPGGVPVPL
ncbi:MAG: carboxypeptidase-like regulatory domain-containing protein [Desulfuromonadaceae bacterium]